MNARMNTHQNQRVVVTESTVDLSRYMHDPVGYVRDVLGAELTAQQKLIAVAVDEGEPVLVESGHNVGKTFLAAALVNWWYDTRNPSATITTAPTQRDVRDLLWTEIRLQRQRSGLPMSFAGPRDAQMMTGHDHYAKGFTASRGESFQGRHRQAMFFVFDECEGIEPNYWTTMKTMYQRGKGHAVLAIGNPTTTSSQAYLESLATYKDGKPKWKRFNLSALDHPNVAAGLRGETEPVPHAVTLQQVEDWIADWCLPVADVDRKPTDFQWPPLVGKWWRPGPIAEPRILGRRPSGGVHSVWSDYLWSLIESAVIEMPIWQVPQIGNDVAHFGDDFTTFHVRCGGNSLHHEAVNGWEPPETAHRLKELCSEWCDWQNKRVAAVEPLQGIRPEEILCKIDGDAWGKSVLSLGRGWNWICVCASSTATVKSAFPNRRSELWFDTAYRAKQGLLSIRELPQDVRGRLRIQALTPTYEVDPAGRRVVEPKEVSKAELGRSPDDMDGMNLAYCEQRTPGPISAVEDVKRNAEPTRESAASRRGLWGRS